MERLGSNSGKSVRAQPSVDDDGQAQIVGLADHLDAVLVRIDSLRDRPSLSIGVGVAVVAVVLGGWWVGRPGRPAPVEAAIPLAATTTIQGSSTTSPERLLIHVAGEVKSPGIVILEPGARVIDAVEAAGGPTATADVHQLNLAAPLVDGLQVRVPAEGETIVSPFGVVPDNVSTGPVDINAATPSQLETLPGIGPSLASAIVDWRQEHGPFATVEQLLDVPGIGPSKLESLADHVIV